MKEMSEKKTNEGRRSRKQKYLAWGQCSGCLDSFEVEVDILPLSPWFESLDRFPIGDETGITHVTVNKGIWIVLHKDYRAKIADSRVRLEKRNGTWGLFHKNCQKPFRIWSVQKGPTGFLNWPAHSKENEVLGKPSDEEAGNQEVEPDERFRQHSPFFRAEPKGGFYGV